MPWPKHWERGRGKATPRTRRHPPSEPPAVAPPQRAEGIPRQPRQGTTAWAASTSCEGGTPRLARQGHKGQAALAVVCGSGGQGGRARQGSGIRSTTLLGLGTVRCVVGGSNHGGLRRWVGALGMVLTSLFFLVS